MEKVSHRRFGNVRQLPSGRWQARWTGPDGYVHKAPATFETDEAARAWLAEQEAAALQGRLIDDRRSGLTFEALAEQWRAETGHKRASTLVRDHGYLARYLLPAFGADALAQLTPARLAAWVSSLRAQDLAPATIGKAAQILGQILDLAVRDGRLAENPATKITNLPRVEPADMMALTRPEIDRLADAIDPRYRALVVVACHTGLRMGELTGLVAGDVDLIRRRLTVTRNVVEVSGHLCHGTVKTSAGRRVVPLDAAAIEALTPLVGGAGHPDDLLFTAPGGGFLRLAGWRQRFWKPATHAAGLDGLRCHDMRHTAVTLWCQAGIDPKTIAAWAGHRSVVTVLDRYARYMPNTDDTNLAKLDAHIKAS